MVWWNKFGLTNGHDQWIVYKCGLIRTFEYMGCDGNKFLGKKY